jgi:hypothetical protein
VIAEKLIGVSRDHRTVGRGFARPLDVLAGQQIVNAKAKLGEGLYLARL